MGFSLQGANRGGSSFNANSFTGVGMSGGGGNATEAPSQFKIRVAGTFSNMAVSANNVGTSRVVRFRKNTANGNQVVTPTDTTAGIYSDAGNTDVVASLDLLALSLASTGTPTYFWIRNLFTGTANHTSIYHQLANFSTSAASTSYYLNGYGFSQNVLSTNETLVKTRIRAGGVMQNAQANVTAARATNTTVVSRVGGVTGGILLTCTGGVTGLFEDTSGTDTLVAGNDFNWMATTGTGADTFTISLLGGVIVNSAASKNDIFARGTGTDIFTASATQRFTLPHSQLAIWTLTEANVQLQHGFSVQVSNIRGYVSANSLGTDATLTSRTNTPADGNQTVAITATVTGLFEDTSHSDNYLSTDNFCVGIVNGTSGTVSFEWMGATELDTTPIVSTSSGAQFLMLLGLGT